MAHADPENGSQRAVALARIFAIGAIFLTVRTEGPLALTEPEFDLAILIALVYAIAMLVLSGLKRRPGWLEPVSFVADYALLGLLVYLSGGPFSEVRLAYFIIPASAAVLRSLRASAASALAGPLSYSCAALLVDPGELPGDLTTLLTIDVYLVGFGLAATTTSLALRRRSEELARRQQESRSLTARLIEADDASRRDLARELHDHPVQLLSGAQRSFGKALEGDASAAAEVARLLADAEHSLRETMFDLHPYALGELGLAAAIEKVGLREAERAGMRFALASSLEAHRELDEQRVFSIARELIRNAAAHSVGSEIVVELSADSGHTKVVVCDDGAGGLDATRRATAVRGGHFGLAGVEERVRDVEGSILIHSVAREGTSVSVRLPQKSL